METNSAESAEPTLGTTEIVWENLSDKEKIDDAIMNATPEEALEFVRYVNGSLCHKERKKSDICGDEVRRVMVESNLAMSGEKELIAFEPTKQIELFGEYFEALKEVEDRTKRAALAYYGIVNLHLFEDGNGRTARAIFGLVRDGNVDSLDGRMLSHSDAKYGSQDDGRRLFEETLGVAPAEWLRNYANMAVMDEMLENGEINSFAKGKALRTRADVVEGSLAHLMVNAKNEQDLTPVDRRKLDFVVSDNVGYCTLSGMAIASVLNEKDGDSEVLQNNYNKNTNAIVLRVSCDKYASKDDKAKMQETFEGWGVEDYKKLMRRYDDLKERQNKMIIKFFVDENDYSVGDGDERTIADAAVETI